MSFNPYKELNISYRYDKNTGEIPVVGDNVMVDYTTDKNLDGKIGKYVGKSDNIGVSGIILFEEGLDSDGSLAVNIPFVCLKKV